eukprot:CAMPEP_0119119310 /NCGR_PEP_ID=MMETSP1310-20130426/855_1 /TAXON_ID=464262 /ORGANISM="Genus nov. species nov., Strain RCC2339" /LENGTH=83 /DNA_ID=CAMNT_0007108735 /DNA_START=234 /DNA_END=482 /DNA_ORIENTATION=-
MVFDCLRGGEEPEPEPEPEPAPPPKKKKKEFKVEVVHLETYGDIKERRAKQQAQNLHLIAQMQAGELPAELPAGEKGGDEQAG